MYRSTLAWITALLPALLLAATPAPAETPATLTSDVTAAPSSGAYCLDEASMYLALEEMTTALKGVARARESLLLLDDATTANMQLGAADAALSLAVGRGSGARIAAMIDAALATKKDGQPKATLVWFPAIRQAIAGLPNDPTREAVSAQMDRAEGLFQGRSDGDEVETLLGAKQLLLCDPLHIPLHQALVQLERLQRGITSGDMPTDNDFGVMLDLLNRALDYGLRRLVDLQQAA